MKKFLTLLVGLPVLAAFFYVNALSAQDSYQVGDQVEDFLLPSVSGNEIGMANYDAADGYIVVFTCNHCPFSKLYEDRIIALHEKFADMGYPVIAINSNDANQYKEDSFKNMKKRAKEKSFPFEYCYDETQEIAQKFGASRTPEVYLVSKRADGLYLEYTGAIDDNARDESKIEEKYLEKAIMQLREGETIEPTQTKAVGCTIKWKKA